MTWRLTLALLLLSGCRGETTDVIERFDAGPSGECEGAVQQWLEDPSQPASCDFEGTCVVVDECCEITGACVGAVLFVNERCTRCDPCTTDLECPTRWWCEGGQCVRCRELPPLPDCPPPSTPLIRNGCSTGRCLPPSECLTDADCGARRRCIRGEACEECDDITCCANRCASDACAATTSPEWCADYAAACPCGSGPCLARDCTCMGDTWTCAAECIDIRIPGCDAP